MDIQIKKYQDNEISLETLIHYFDKHNYSEKIIWTEI